MPFRNISAGRRHAFFPRVLIELASTHRGGNRGVFQKRLEGSVVKRTLGWPEYRCALVVGRDGRHVTLPFGSDRNPESAFVVPIENVVHIVTIEVTSVLR